MIGLAGYPYQRILQIFRLPRGQSLVQVQQISSLVDPNRAGTPGEQPMDWLDNLQETCVSDMW